jgi:extracellular factor (EF) 3-hydroxypalmitic acid methyl ester biosynthesis protein
MEETDMFQIREKPNYAADDKDVERALNPLIDILDAAGPERFTFELKEQLARLRDATGSEWSGSVMTQVREHQAIRIARTCPIASHASARPRGYPGDAGLLDLLYQHPAHKPVFSDDVSRRVYAVCQNAKVARSVRYRRMLLADAIDHAAIAAQQASILSLACGHLREVEWSNALATGGVGRFVAADQDELSLASIKRDYCAAMPVIEPVACSVRDILKGGGEKLGRFDLVYSAGLYDYLPKAVAEALTARLFTLLNPGGRLLIGNFGSGLDETAFMEAVMDWPLIWRSPEAIADFGAQIDPGLIAQTHVFADPTGTCWYLDITRR